MKRTLFLVVTALCVSVPATSTASPSQSGKPSGSGTTTQKNPVTQKIARKNLPAFASDRELESFLRRLAEEQQRVRKALANMPMPAPSAPAAGTMAAQAGAAPDSVTNVQHAGVDEGGIVKTHGDHLVVLRRGRLFTVAIGDNELRPVSAVDAFAPDINPSGTWYDEMLVSGDTVVVIGYSYQRGGTEIGLFDIDGTGHLNYRSTYHLRSNDYYSSRNYSSRLIGTKLIFYTPLYLSLDPSDPLGALPAFRKWRPGATAAEFRRIATASRIYRAPAPAPAPAPAQANVPSPMLGPTGPTAMHTVSVCDLARPELECQATVVMGPAGRVFYVSPQAVYVWTTDWTRLGDSSRRSSMVFQMPLDGSAPSALQVSGSPVDQFSFLESGDGYLNVLVRSNAAGDGMWSAEVGQGDVALLRVARDTFSDGSEAAPAARYRALPKPAGYTFQNRFVGNYLLYGTGSGWGRPTPQPDGARLYAVRWAGNAVFDLPLQHGVDRIEALGSDAVVVGTNGPDLHFSAVRLNDQAAVAGGYVRPNAAQGELRSHGFFYKPESPSGGLLGLPISRPSRPGYRHLFESSASILFLRNQALRFSEVGELDAQSEKAVDDRCRASCVDWYGNARPLFVGRRVFALLGYELVEGALADGRMREMRRVSYAPVVNSR